MSHPSNHPSVTSSVPAAAAETAPSANAGQQLASFNRMEAEILAVSEDDLEVVNIDVTVAIDTVCGNMDELLALRDAMATLGGFDISLLDKLQDYAQALGHTHSLYRIAIAPKAPVTKLGAEVTAIRDLLFSDATALAKRGLLEEETVRALRSPSGYRNIAYDTTSLVALFRKHARQLDGKTPVSRAELDRAVLTAEALLAALGERAQAPEITAAATLLRQRAYTLFIRAYDQVRRAVAFLRWNKNDAETIAPSLWAGRGKRPTTETEFAAPGTAPASTSLSTDPIAPAPPAVPVGLPGSNPFTS